MISREVQFKASELIPLDWQYAIVNKNTKVFQIGQAVFHKLVMKYNMTVIAVNESKVVVTFYDENNKLLKREFSPISLLRYEDCVFISYRRKTTICLN